MRERAFDPLEEASARAGTGSVEDLKRLVFRIGVPLNAHTPHASPDGRRKSPSAAASSSWRTTPNWSGGSSTRDWTRS